MSLSGFRNSSLVVTVQGRSFEPRELYVMAAIASGGKFTTGYQDMLDLPISQFLFHLEVFNDVAERLNPKQSPESLGQVGGEFEWIENE